MEDKKLVNVKTNSMVRWLISKSCYYTYRQANKETGRYDTYFVDCPLFRELCEIYNGLSQEEKCTYVEKHSQKAI